MLDPLPYEGMLRSSPEPPTWNGILESLGRTRCSSTGEAFLYPCGPPELGLPKLARLQLQPTNRMIGGKGLETCRGESGRATTNQACVNRQL